MRREGRQHGMVRTYRILPAPLNLRPEPRFNRYDSPPTAGLFTRAPSKPTNHSKFTGKCGRPRCSGCHLHPACKSRDKSKGTHKLRSSDVVSNSRLVSWRVVDCRPGSNFAGVSATGMLNLLGTDYLDDYDYDDDDADCVEDPAVGVCEGLEEERENESGAGADGGIIDDEKDHGDHDEDDGMSFCEVGLVWEQVEGDEDWCVVEEL
ncbi:uncharacterized protein LOC131168632 [Malania oleifera]|uniref:uncharacterized protein LOC131168632 n=1 Tax=Malania oleifera TaxID=397392 RepID=UPI0025AE993D|nr:uncharacterized protein LOC131168632 [Malania oleifera]